MKIGVVIDEPKRPNGKTSFTMFWVSSRQRRAQVFNAVLEDYQKENEDLCIFDTEEQAKAYAGWEAPRCTCVETGVTRHGDPSCAVHVRVG